MVPLALAGAIILVIAGAGSIARQISLAVYGLCLVLLFAVSASYHRGPWSPRTRRIWGRLDHATIFLAIAGTYTPVVVNVLKGWPSIVLLVVIWVLAGSGVIVATTGIPLPRWVTVVLYLGVGSSRRSATAFTRADCSCWHSAVRCTVRARLSTR
jgi:hemolysin III